MHDLDFGLAERRAVGDAAGLERFASEVVSRLASRATTRGRPCQSLLSDLIDAAVSVDPSRIPGVLSRFRRARVSSAALVDVYIPAAARLLGDKWMEDHLSFSSVAIASGRLQSLLRALGGEWAADRGETRDGRPVVLLATPQGESHVLGAMVATSMLRRAGVSVCLRMAADRDEVVALAAERAFDAAMLSVSCRDGVDAARDLVKTIRMARPDAPIVVGGVGMSVGGDAGSCAGADLATSDMTAALRFCGIPISVDHSDERA
jgi:methanogenic corrinoid protein MtbC1